MHMLKLYINMMSIGYDKMKRHCSKQRKCRYNPRKQNIVHFSIVIEIMNSPRYITLQQIFNLHTKYSTTCTSI